MSGLDGGLDGGLNGGLDSGSDGGSDVGFGTHKGNKKGFPASASNGLRSYNRNFRIPLFYITEKSCSGSLSVSYNVSAPEDSSAITITAGQDDGRGNFSSITALQPHP